MNNAQQDADNSGRDDNQTVNSASQSRRSGSRSRNTNNNNSPGIEWNALQNACCFYQQPTLAPTTPVNCDPPSVITRDGAIQFKQMENMDDVIFIDTGSSVHTIKNRLLLSRIRVSDRPILMQTNAGSTRIDLEGDFFGLGVMYWDEDLQVNIVCFADLVLRYRITYDSEIEDAFYVHTDKGIIKFVRYGKLYGYKVSKKYLDAVAKSEGYARPTKQPTTQHSHAVPTVAVERCQIRVTFSVQSLVDSVTDCVGLKPQ